jgi:hypothetical protein
MVDNRTISQLEAEGYPYPATILRVGDTRIPNNVTSGGRACLIVLRKIVLKTRLQ